MANAEGWVEVDKNTLQHTRFANVFSLGDSAGTPNAKTGAAVRKQAPIMVANLLRVMKENKLTDDKRYHGYTSCPLTTGYGEMLLAEFDYDNNPDPSLPIDTTKPRWSIVDTQEIHSSDPNTGKACFAGVLINQSRNSND